MTTQLTRNTSMARPVAAFVLPAALYERLSVGLGLAELTPALAPPFGEGARIAASMPAAALVAGILSGVAVYLLAYRRGLDSYRLVLAGLGISGFAASLTTWILTLGDVTSAA